MQFDALESSLKEQIFPSYMINGGESFLTTTALKKIEKALNISMPEINKVIVSFDSPLKAKDIVASALVMPLGDPYRLIVVHDYMGKKNEAEKAGFLNYLDHPCENTVIVFFSTNKSDFFSSFESRTCSIDCQKLSPVAVKKYVVDFARENNMTFGEGAVDKLCDFCNYSITKTDTELKKLLSIFGSNNISVTNVQDYVTKDLEYAIFDLTNALGNKNSTMALRIVDDMLKNKEQPSNIVSMIENHFRRLFHVARSNSTTRELAVFLDVKEFAIQKYREQSYKFNNRQLKDIFDLATQMEFNIKSGVYDGKTALNILIQTILKN